MNSSDKENPFVKTLQFVGKTLIVTVAASFMVSKFREMPVKTEPLTPTAIKSILEEQKLDGLSKIESGSHEIATLANLLDSNPEFVEFTWKLMQEKWELGEAEEVLEIVGKLVVAQPNQIQWKFTKACILDEMGRLQESREAFEEILAVHPLLFEALFKNAWVMHRCGEGKDVIVRLEKALSIAMNDNKLKEARDVKLIIAHFQFLQKNVDEALKSYEELSKEDPKDCKPHYCKAMIYIWLDQDAKAIEELAKYRALSSEDFDVDDYDEYINMKPFGTDSKKS